MRVARIVRITTSKLYVDIQHVAVVGVHQNGARFSTPYSLIVDTNTIR